MSGTGGARALPGNRWDLLDGVVPDPLPSVSVIVAHFRQPEQLARTLRALERQDYPGRLREVIVADDGSPEPPVVPPGVRLVRQGDDGFRLAAVRNLGAAEATGDVLVFLDADTAPEPGFVRALTRLPALSTDCVTVGRRRHAALGGAPVTDDIRSAARGRELPEPAWLTHAYRSSRDLLDADDRSYRFVIGAVLACSRRFFAEVGGFDESFTSYGGEDWEWAYRAWLRGAVLAHVPGAVAWHDGPHLAGRGVDALAARNEEAIRLAGLIPVAGSRGRGVRPAKADIGVRAPMEATPAQGFVSLDSVIAAIPGAEAIDPAGNDRIRFDRMRLEVDVLRPVRARPHSLGDALAYIAAEGLGQLVVTDPGGVPLVRITATRARARAGRWGRDDLFPAARRIAPGLEVLGDEVDVAAYLGGWG